MPAFSIGVDLGGTNLRIAAIDEQGSLLEKLTLGTRVSRGRDWVVTQMCEAIQQVATKFQNGHTLRGIGIGVPGIIDMETGMVRESPNLPGWDDYPVREEIEQRLKARVILENDANAAAMGEKWLGAGRDFDDLCMITLGTGVGGGVVLNGRVWHGLSGMAGEIGHTTVDPNGPLCGCGNHGCLEAYASATAIVRMAKEAIARGEAPSLRRACDAEPEFSSKIVYNLAIQGDSAAREIFRQVGRAIGIVFSDIVNALNLPIYVVGGGASGAWEAFAPSLLEELRCRSMVYAATAPDWQGERHGASAKVAPPKAHRRTIVTKALMGSDAGLYGAARLPMLNGEK